MENDFFRKSFGIGAVTEMAVGDCNVSSDFVVADVGDVLFLGGFVFDIVCEQEVIDALYQAF